MYHRDRFRPPPCEMGNALTGRPQFRHACLPSDDFPDVIADASCNNGDWYPTQGRGGRCATKKPESVSTMTGNALAYFHEQFHQPEDRSAIRVRLILL
jgi:hypothetical protein